MQTTEEIKLKEKWTKVEELAQMQSISLEQSESLVSD